MSPGGGGESGRASVWATARGPLPVDRPLVMGILNVTPDSFSDAGELSDPDRALRRGEAMVAAGAAILDVGGESTRPGAEQVGLEEELRRVLPAIERLERELEIPLSVDTRKSQVARRALESGAAIVNDVSGLVFDPQMPAVVAEHRAGVVLMHMRGTPADMRSRTDYADVVGEVVEELREAVFRARAAGIARESIVLDPGIGFAKTAEQSLSLLAGLERLVAEGFPVMVGASRKSFLGRLVGIPVEERATASAVAAALAWERGARIFRVHDVEETCRALVLARAVGEAGRGTGMDPAARRGVVDGAGEQGDRE